MKTVYHINAYLVQFNQDLGYRTIYETESYEDAVAKMEAAEIRDTRPQLNLIADDGETAIKLAVKDECGLRFDDF